MSDVGYFFDRIGELIWANGEFEGKLRRLIVNWSPSQIPLFDKSVPFQEVAKSEKQKDSRLGQAPEGSHNYQIRKIEPPDIAIRNGQKVGAPLSVSALHADFRSVHELANKGCTILPHDVMYSAKPEELVGQFDLIVVGISRFYEQNLLFFRLAAQLVCAGGVVCIAGPNPWGIKRLEKEFSRYWDNVEIVSKFHGRYFWASALKTEAEAVQAEWAIESAPRVLEPGGLTSTPGNFSWKCYDTGSQFLINTLIEEDHLQALRGAGADLGAGYGFLTKSLLSVRAFEKIFLLESDRWALQNAEGNISAAFARFLWCDVSRLGGRRSAEVEGLEYNLQWVIMNPPFHEISGDVSLELGLSFFTAAHSLLGPRGRLFWVANRHLPYLSEVEKKFRKVSVLNRDSRFLVGLAEK